MRPDPRAALRELARATRRHRALLSAGLAAAAVATALPTLAPPAPTTTRVLTAARDLAAGTPLTLEDLVGVDLPRAAVPHGALADDALALGRVVVGQVRQGEPLTDVRLLGAGLLAGVAPGLVAAPVRVADGASATLLHPGDRVDVLAASTARVSSAAAVVAGGVQLLAVPPATNDADGALLVLACTPDTAARLAAAAVSSRLSVTVLGR